MTRPQVAPWRRKAHKLTQEQQQTVVELYERGAYSQQQLADSYGVSSRTINKIIRKEREQ